MEERLKRIEEKLDMILALYNKPVEISAEDIKKLAAEAILSGHKDKLVKFFVSKGVSKLSELGKNDYNELKGEIESWY